MYKITFEAQPRQGTPDYESNSIVLTKADYEKLPELSADIFDEKCKFLKGIFSEKVRMPTHCFSAVWISRDNWELEEPANAELTGGYIHSIFQWVFVCLDAKENIWIAFKYYDLATIEDCFGATVGVAFPEHDEVYRLDEKCKEIVRKFYA